MPSSTYHTIQQQAEVINNIVKYEDQCDSLQLTVINGSGPSLLRKGWLLKIKLKWEKVH